MTYGRGHRQIINHNPNRGGGFLFPNHDRSRDYSSPNEYRIKTRIPSFSENLNIESFLDQISEVLKFFDMTCISEENMSSLWHKAQGRRSRMLRLITSHKETPTSNKVY